MTATSAGSSSCLAAKGLDISLAALQRQDPYINNIVDVASQVALYTYNNRSNEWEKTEVEGTLFIYTRLASPRHGFTIMNRLSMENLTEPITKDLDFQLQDPFLLYRNARLVIHGIWFYDKEDCQRIAQRMKILTQQEQVLAQSQGGWLSPAAGGGVGGGGRAGGTNEGGRGGGSEGKAVDIIQMLTKARTEYDKEKTTSEPKEIGGSSVLYGNPNLIKPIPVKPNTQDSEGAEPKSLSLATLFGSQHKHHHSSKPDPVPPVAVPVTGSPAEKLARPPVARTLTYDDTVNSGRSVTSKGGNAALARFPDGGIRAVVGEDGGNVVVGLLPSPTTAHQQQQQEQPQHCPAIQKLMQGQRGVGGVLQTVSESPENRLCDNGVPLEHHHHHHHLYHHHHQQHHHHHHQQQQAQPDPIKRLFQAQPPLPPSTSFASAAPPCCSNAPPLQQSSHLSSQPVMMDSVSCSHLQAQQNQQLFLSLSKHQPEAQHNSQSASAPQGPGFLPSQVTSDQVIRPSQGLSSQMPGVVSPHELLQKLQLVQQEQSLASSDLPRLCPGLAPRFLGPTQSQSTGSVIGPVPNQTAATAGQKAALQFQVISPQRIPATVAPTLLLSPSVFTQVKSSDGLSAVAQENCPAPSTLPRLPLQEEVRVLSRSQFQATLLHLIQTDSSFLNTIYEAYMSRFANDSSSKY
ncbi:mRNA-decapping enzyme 1B isoform X2 [Toxotes jaculatrix]|uniref:mRNA-decapping enzyme 1B isoform X2 n=1 Tax=Toxotes jaculatrix TaxID=941984 RepID=UPI001B3AC998|nr:mRNA-decapping enzyme 1B isoform X2 [Toxotes jaculatrix]